MCKAVPEPDAVEVSVEPSTLEALEQAKLAEEQAAADAKAKLEEAEAAAAAAALKAQEEAAAALKAEEEEKAKKAAEEEAEKKKEAESAPKPAAKKKATAKKKVLKAGEAVEAKDDADMTKLNYELEVKIVSARGVRDADWAIGTGDSDPYCVAEVVGKKEKITTKVINDQKDPVWNETGKLVAAQTDSIQFSVFDSDVGKEDDLLGKVSLPCSKCVPGGWSGEIKMKQTSDTAKAVNAYLKVKVTVLNSFVEGVEESDPAPKAKAKAKAKVKAAAKA